jgi:exopolysaccharide biosynthesis polyprenyl glycosylphosphotransferase
VRRSLRLPSPVKRRLGAADTYLVRELHLTPAVEGPRRREVAGDEPRRVPPRSPWLLDGPGWPLLLLAGDVVGLVLALAAARLAAPEVAVTDAGEVLLWVYPALVLAVFVLRGLFRERLTWTPLDDVARVVAATSLAAMLLIAGAVLIDPDASSTRLVARAWLFACVYVAGVRVLLGLTRHQLRAARRLGRPTLIVGAGRIGAAVERRLEEQPDIGLRPIGYLDLDPVPAEDVEGRRAPVLGGPADVARIAAETGAEHVILAFVSEPDSVLIPLVRECERRRLKVSLVPRLFESMGERVQLDHLGGLPVLAMRQAHPQGWQFTAKHCFDRAAAALLLLVLAPLLLAAAVAVKLSSPGPVLFRQRRIGRDGHDFQMLKFRSMRQPAEARTEVLVPAGLAPGGVEGEDRRTRVGALLRRLSIDELPQLFNVLKGDMSIVGPRPERPEFVELFGRRIDRYGDRHRVKSGMTGWAQVNGLRGRTSLADRLEWDNYYIQSWSLWLDVKILLMTVLAILRPAE